MAPVLLAVLLSPPLAAWRQEIEKTGGQTVTLLRLMPHDSVPDGTAHRSILENYTGNPSFQAQYERAQALSITYQGSEGRHSFVLVNPRHTNDLDEDYVIAHELGHLWLKAQRYPAPAFLGGPTACLAIHSGDVVQHQLIRAEMDLRKVEWRPAWIRSLKAALAALERSSSDGAQPTRCDAISRVALWIDVELGITGEDWAQRDRFLSLLTQRTPAIQPAAAELAGMIRSERLVDKQRHQQALNKVFTRLKQMALALPN